MILSLVLQLLEELTVLELEIPAAAGDFDLLLPPLPLLLLFLRQPPPTGTLLNAPPLVQ